MAVLTSEAVEDTYVACLAEDAPAERRVIVAGITASTGFDRQKIDERKAFIGAMLMDLPEDFMKSKGGGMSFLNACQNRQDQQWTGMHLRMGQLFDLGVAAGFVECLLPREMWKALPGGMPYYVVRDDKIDQS